jgi:type VI secretion system protein VasL
MMPGSEIPQERAEPVDEVKWVYVVQPENQPNAEDRTTAPVLSDMETLCRRDVFHAGDQRRRGVGRGFLSRPDPLTTQAFASLAPLPEVLTPVQQDALAQQGTLPSTSQNAAACPTG